MAIHMYGRCTSHGHKVSEERRAIFLLIPGVAQPAIISLAISRNWLLMSKSQVITMSKSQVITITLKAQVSLSN